MYRWQFATRQTTALTIAPNRRRNIISPRVAYAQLPVTATDSTLAASAYGAVGDVKYVGNGWRCLQEFFPSHA
ncbi:hypothetical protein BCEP27_10922 [Burkholderia cepacia]